MYWNDDEENDQASQKEDVIELVFQMQGRTLPQNYLGAISSALHQQVELWQNNHSLAFYVHIAGEEGNGWYRGSSDDDLIYLSRRNTLVFRAPEALSREIEKELNIILNVDGHLLGLRHKHNKSIKPAPTLYSRYVICTEDNEAQFVETIAQQLNIRDIKIKKLLCGKQRSLTLNNQKMQTRSLMLEFFRKEDSISIQQKGIGDFQKSGCGVFVPHKSVK